MRVSTHDAVKAALTEEGRPREMGALIDDLLEAWLKGRRGRRRA